MAIDYKNDYDYANSRLSGSIVEFNSAPVYIFGVGDEGSVEYRYLGQNNIRRYHSPLKEFDLTPLKLGYINQEARRSFYITRLPSRSWKQGLTMNHLVYGTAEPFRVNMDDRSFVNMLRGVYPSLHTCLELMVNQEAISLAFSKNFAFSPFKQGQCKLLYKEKIVGDFNLGEHHLPILDAKHQFLRETLEGELDANR